ncbi:MAG: MerR family transcriptional regulator [Myxococcota bacterium]|jgi:methylmalonyl-CoA mutase cobalamin-binding subunit|nr:MerR family transcriptional regulator [Myxococcota bacterium]
MSATQSDHDEVLEGDNGFVSIGGLARACGLAVETLRNWERRYGFPMPHRRGSGHRRYPMSLVPRLSLIREVIDFGFKPSFAVSATEDELVTAIISARGAAPRGRAGEPLLEIEDWLTLVRSFGGASLELKLRRSIGRLGASRFVLERAVPFLDELGRKWESGALTVAHEHFASAVVENVLSSVWRPLSLRPRGSRVVLASFEGELHTLGLHMAAVLLTMAGFEVVFLGANTPLEDLLLAGNEPQVAAVIVGFVKSSNLETGAERLAALRAGLEPTRTLVAGGDVPLLECSGVIHIKTMAAFESFLPTLGEVD